MLLPTVTAFILISIFIVPMPSLITEKFSNTKADPSQESTERLLAEEAGQPWSGHEDSSTDAHNRTLTFLVQMTTVGLFFLIGGLFGFRWRGDLDHVCSEHVSQYCECISILHLLAVDSLGLSSTNYERCWNQLPCPGVQWVASPREYLPARCQSRGGCGVGCTGYQLHVLPWSSFFPAHSDFL